MHLFYTQPEKQGNTLTIREPRVVHHMTRVLRMQSGDMCMIQYHEGERVVRWTAELHTIRKKEVLCTIREEEMRSHVLSGVQLLIALPNKQSKLDLIVQKCTEVGVDTLYFRASKRSVLRAISPTRMERIHTIALESVEQCKRRSVPEIVYLEDPCSVLTDQCCVLFDFVDDSVSKKTIEQSYVGIVGPEGHFDEEEIQRFSAAGAKPCGLGDYILRTETAAIIAGWHLVQQSI